MAAERRQQIVYASWKLTPLLFRRSKGLLLNGCDETAIAWPFRNLTTAANCHLFLLFGTMFRFVRRVRLVLVEAVFRSTRTFICFFDFVAWVDDVN